MIGILAGMGPRSTSPFLEKVLDECVRQYRAVHDDDFPAMMIHALPTPFRLDAPLDHGAMRASIRAGLLRLIGTGVAIVAIPCNVAHIYFDDIVAGVDVPVLHLIKETAGALPEGIGPVVVLATRPIVETGLYQQALGERGFDVRDGSRYQSEVDALIGGVKRSVPTEALDAQWDGLARKLKQEGVEGAVLGSTDLSAVSATEREDRFAVIDSGGALAAELVRRWRAMEEIA